MINEEDTKRARCINCGVVISPTKKIKKCSNCQRTHYWKHKYDGLEEEFEQHKKICSKLISEQNKELKKLNPALFY